MALYLGSEKLKPYLGASKIKEAYLGSELVYKSQSEAYSLTAKGQPGYFNSGSGESANINSRPWRSVTFTVPAGFSNMHITEFSAAGVFGESQTQLLVESNVVKTTGTRYDYNMVTSWVGSVIPVSGGQVLTFRVRGARDTNRDSQGSDIEGSITFYFD